MMRTTFSKMSWGTSRVMLLLSIAALVLALTVALGSPASAKHKKHHPPKPAALSTYIVQQTGPGGPGANLSASASCDSGDKVTGGGYSGKASGTQIKDTFPDSESSWTVNYDVNGANPNPITAWAVCLDLGQPYV